MGIVDFKVARLLGKGSFGAVYKAIRHSDGFEYAIKKVNVKDFSMRERQEAVNEIRLLASLFHPNIIRYCEAFTEKQNIYIVTEYAKRGDLDRCIRRRKDKRQVFKESKVWCYFLQILDGLRYLHKQDILHRDLKPKNIFISSKDLIRIGDLGSCKLMKSRFTRTQVGTPYYMPPEIWQRMSYNHKCDVWSLGCVLFELCALCPPFQAHDINGLRRQVCNAPTPRMPSRYSHDLASLVSRMLSKHGNYRPSVEEIYQSPHAQNNMQYKPSDVYDECGHVGESFHLVNTIKMPYQMPGRSLKLNLPKTSYPERNSYTSPAKTRQVDEAHERARVRRSPSDPQVRKFASPSKEQTKFCRAHTSPSVERMKLPKLGSRREKENVGHAKAARGRAGNRRVGAPKARRALGQQRPSQAASRYNQRVANIFSHYNYNRPIVPSSYAYNKNAAGRPGYRRGQRSTRPW